MSITFAHRERLRDRARHIDLLDQVADTRVEAAHVRRVLGPELQRKLDALPPLTEADLDAHQAWLQAPFPTTANNHAHRYSACKSGPCQQGRKLCPSPQACQIEAANEAAAREPRPPLRAGDFWLVVALVIASWAVAAALGTTLSMVLPW